MRAIDLFCGAGGSTEGMSQAGIEVIFAVNHWRQAVDIHLLRAGSPYTVDARSAKRPSGARETADLAL